MMMNNQHSPGSCQPSVGRQLGTRREGAISEAGPLVKIIIICLITIIIMIFSLNGIKSGMGFTPLWSDQS